LKVLFATTNQHKVEEAQAIARELAPFVEVHPFPVPLEEPRGTFEEVSLEKAKQAFQRAVERGLSAPLFVEDAGIVVEAFSHTHPFPGPFSRYVYETLGLEGLLGALDRVVEEGLDRGRGRRAHFISIITYTEDGSTFHQFKGLLEGRIADRVYIPEGEWKGMMYDRVFIPEGHSETLSMLGLEVKNRLSHRRRALESFFAFLRERAGR